DAARTFAPWSAATARDMAAAVGLIGRPDAPATGAQNSAAIPLAAPAATKRGNAFTSAPSLYSATFWQRRDKPPGPKTHPALGQGQDRPTGQKAERALGLCRQRQVGNTRGSGFTHRTPAALR